MALYEIGIAVALPILLVILAKRYAPKNPNRDKAAVFTGGEPLEKEEIGRNYGDLVRYTSALLAVSIYTAGILLYSFNKFWSTVFLGIFFLVVMLI